MDIQTIKEESLLAVTKAEKITLRTHKMFGAGPAAVSLCEQYFDAVYDALPEAIERGRRTHGVKALMAIVAQLPRQKLALAALQGLMQSIASNDRFGQTLRRLGGLLCDEAYAAELTERDPKLAHRLELKMRQKVGGRGRRVKMTKAQVEAAGYQIADWPKVWRVKAGAWLLDVLLSTLPEVFVLDGHGEFKCVTMTEEACDTAGEVMNALEGDEYRILPMSEPPIPWTGFDVGGTPHHRDTIIRSYYTDTRAVVAAAIKSGQMLPALDGLNALQSVGWKINERMASIIRDCYNQRLLIKGMPREPKRLPKWDDNIDPITQAIELAQIKRHNQRALGDKLTIEADLARADSLKGKAAWWTPMNLDFRGRVYAMTKFNFARDDRVRSMFLFAEGEPLGPEGLEWLKIHVANTGAFERIDKEPLAARVAWTDAQLDRIRAMTEAPMRETWWHQASKPFLFLAACFELVAAVDTGPTYICHLPVSFDGTCSGLQHLCAMTRAPEGHLVNLCPTLQRPSDVYATVASRVSSRLAADASATWSTDDAWRAYVAACALTPRYDKNGVKVFGGCDRAFVKRATMTYSYSSKPHGMAGQLQEDVMRPLQALVTAGELDEHPFGVYGDVGGPDRPSNACRYLAKHIYDAIGEVVSLPGQAMAYLQKIARVLAHEREAVRWTTPVGLPWVNRYHRPITEIVELWLYDKGVRVRMRTEVAVGDNDEIDKEKAANAVAPNFVHACDAAHLLRVAASHAASGGGPIATVHDSFGCLPSRARAFNTLIREELVRMYEQNDVLVQALDQAKRDLTPANWHKLPTVPQYGTLDLKGILDAQFAFS